MALKHAIVWAANGAKISGDDWNSGDHVVDGGGMLMNSTVSPPAVPSAGNALFFARQKAGGVLPAFIGPSGLDFSLQPFLGGNAVSVWAPVGNTNSNSVSAFGTLAPSFTGTATQRNVNVTGSMLTAAKRTGCVSAATAGSTAMIRSQVGGQYSRGSSAGIGGFRAVFRFGCSDAATVAGARTFVGMSATSFSNIDPSTMVNMIGIGTDNGDSTFSIFHNDDTGTATKIPLGANFPDHTLSQDLYELAVFCAPNSDRIGWEVTRLNTGHVARGVATTDLPNATASLNPSFNRNNNATALAVAIDLVRLYIETDN